MKVNMPAAVDKDQIFDSETELSDCVEAVWLWGVGGVSADVTDDFRPQM